MTDDLLSWLESRAGDLIALLRVLVEMESPSTDKAALDRIAGRLAAELRASGGRVEVLESPETGHHLRATFEGGAAEEGQVLILGHMDTVWDLGTLREMPFRVEQGIARGPGVFDMKAGLVQLVFALRALAANGRRPARRVVALLTSDEEVGSASSRKWIEEEARRSRSALVLEPSLTPGGRVKTFRKGVGIYHLRVEGRAAHAGLDPASGVSAIEEIARQVQVLHRLTDYERGITVNVGTLRAGTRVNVVAAEAEAEIDVRVSTVADGEEIGKRIRGLQPFLDGARLTIAGGMDRPPLERTPAVVALFEKARALAGELGFELGEGPAGGGSDGNLTAGLGVPTLDGLGAVGDGAHARNEHVVAGEMPKRAALLARLLEVL